LAKEVAINGDDGDDEEEGRGKTLFIFIWAYLLFDE
jgi:hypothetical protein